MSEMDSEKLKDKDCLCESVTAVATEQMDRFLNRFNCFKIAVILNTKRLIVFENQSHLSKSGKTLHNYDIFVYLYL